jgi:RHH-type proline utilization regulon transcriptional repressor/proline dehydrogenase/delta 1-pyrroline-5-carboxylate dehydrogenase
MTAFRNEPILELRRAVERDRLREALASVDAALPVEVPVIVGGERRFAPDFASEDPCTPVRTVARATTASAADVDAAVGSLRPWVSTSAAERAIVLRSAAADLRRRRYELAALVLRECGKPWADADADVCEAIDFLEYYAAAAVALDERAPLLQLPGETNSLRYRPRGVTAVIAPWNFPLAIATGMTAAALATGNAVALKPAEQSPACAVALVETLLRSGVPARALALLPGDGAVGAALVEHPGVHTIAFTGSASVGLGIVAAAGRRDPARRHITRVVAELGGKNCTIVDADADLDEVVPAVLASAFGFAGQKCSATSRLLVHKRVAAPLTARLRGALETLLVGPADEFGVDVPAVIEGAARERVERLVTDALDRGATGERVARMPSPGGHYVSPTLLWDVPAGAPVLRDEIFGPVLTIEPVASVAEACDLVDAQPQALTGALFSRNPRVVDAVAARTPVGNLYVNRGTTGAMVARQPFGGNRLSGTGPKAGGPDYLLAFADAVVITENTVRHGLAV